MERSFNRRVNFRAELKKLFSCLVFGVFSFIVNANPVTESEARIVALNWINSAGEVYYSNNEILKVISINNDEVPLLYTVIFNPLGWVIVSGENNMEPVLAWSNRSVFPEENKPVQMEGWLNALEDGMKNVIDEEIQPDAVIQQKWQYYSEAILPLSQLKSTTTTVGPLLSTTWNQGRYYNEMCPVDVYSTTGNSHVWVGCVATSMAQIMKYWEYPYAGLGEHSYVHPDYGQLSANFGNTTYIWSSMPDNLTSQNSEVQRIGYHCAVSVDMDFGPGSSGAWLEDAAPAFIDYFKYNSINYISDRDRWASAEWEALLRREIDNGRPILYSGYNASQTSGHAWVCDGYSGSYFHFNWGWSGSGDGNYLLTDLTPLSFNFSYFQSAIFSIEPVIPSGITFPYLQGFETSSVSPFSLMGVYEQTTEEKHTGSQSMRLGKPGISSSATSALSICFTVPADAELNFWVKRVTPEISSQNQQKVLIMPQYGSTPLAEVFNGDYNDADWVNYSFDLSAYNGQDIRVLFIQEVDDYLKKQWMYIDDISLTGIYVNLPPYTPENPIPVNGCAGVSLSPKLMWAGGDPNGDDLTYNVYLGTENPPGLVSSVFDNNYTAQNLPHSTLHFWKIVASDGKLTSESPVWTFTTTGIPPEMGICGLSNLSSTSVNICGEVIDNNGAIITSRGICWDTDQNPTTNDKVTYPQFENEVYTCKLDDLTPFTKYYYRAFAMSNEGTGYSEQGEFTTLSGLPVLIAGNVENIFRTTATVNGEIININDGSISERGVVWSLSEGFDILSGNRVSESGNWDTPGNFNFNLNGLPGPARIFFRFFAVNTAGTAYSEEASFETINTPPYVDLDGDNSSGIAGNDFLGIYTEQEGNGGIADNDILLGDADNDPIQGITVTLQNQVHDDEEYLAITGEHENVNVVGNETDNLVLTAVGSVSYDEWKTILGEIELRNMHDAPVPDEDRVVRVIVSDGIDQGEPALAIMSVIPVNDLPVCTVFPSLDKLPVASETVSVMPGTWEDILDNCIGEIDVSYQWQYRDDLGNIHDIAGATGTELFLNQGLCGTSIRVVEKVIDSDCGGVNGISSQAESEWADVDRKEQNIFFDPLPVHYMHELAFSLEGASSSGLTVSYSAVNENILRISNDTAYLVATGRVIVSCFQQGDECYLPTGKTNRLAVVEKGNQHVENYGDQALSYPDRQVAMPAKASSGLSLTAISSDTLIVKVENDTLNLNGAGAVTLTLFQPGNSNYFPSDTVYMNVVVDKGLQVIVAEYEEMRFGTGSYPCNVFSTSGLPVSLSFSNPGVIEYSADSFKVIGTGEVTISATQEGNEFWYPAVPDIQTITLLKGEQILTIEPIEDKYFNDPDFMVESAISSGQEIVFSISDTSIAAINGGIVHIKDVGTIQVMASNDGNEFWEPVFVQQSLNVLKASQFIKAGNFDTLTYGDPPFSIDFSATSALEVFVDVTDEEVASFNGTGFFVQNAGNTNVIFSQPGNERWNPAEPVTRELVVEKAPQTLYSELPDSVEDHNQNIFAAVFASSGLPVELVSADEQLAGISGDSIEIRSYGELLLTASQQGNQNYLPVQDQFSIIITEPVFIEELADIELTVYPNPANSFIVVVAQGLLDFPCKVKLINTVGIVVTIWTLENRVSSFSLEPVPGGVYLVQFEDQKNIVGQKLIVQK